MVMCLLNQFRFLSKGSVRATGYEINLLLTILNHCKMDFYLFWVK